VSHVVLRTSNKPHFVTKKLLCRIDLTKSIIVWILCSNPLKSEFDRFAVLKLPLPATFSHPVVQVSEFFRGGIFFYFFLKKTLLTSFLKLNGVIYFPKHVSDSIYALISKRLVLEPRIWAHSICISQAGDQSFAIRN